jgi:putative membrane protein
MTAIILALIVINIVLHAYIFVMEAFLWTRPRTMVTFGTTPELAVSTRELAQNQGVYNLFLAAGLVWALFSKDPVRYQATLFFFGCIVVAAVVVGVTKSPRLALTQGSAALLGLILTLIFWS